MTHDEIQQRAKVAEDAAVAAGADAHTAYKARCEAASVAVREKLEQDVREWSAARAERLAADRLMYEGR